ncbi:MAG: hypothetical protein ACOZQL_33465 [Myxococcota bacterium]
MRSTATRNSALLLALVLGAGTPAWAHPKGFHKKLTVTLTPTRLSVLVVMDVDSGDQCLLLREAMDADRDGLLVGDEVKKLRARLVKLAVSPLRLTLSGAPLTLDQKDMKLSLREDRRANDAPLSVAVLLELELRQPFAEGTQLEVTDTAPDLSTIVLQVFQAGAKEPPFEQEVASGMKTPVRVGALSEPKR